VNGQKPTANGSIEKGFMSVQIFLNGTLAKNPFESFVSHFGYKMNSK